MFQRILICLLIAAPTAAAAESKLKIESPSAIREGCTHNVKDCSKCDCGKLFPNAKPGTFEAFFNGPTPVDGAPLQSKGQTRPR